MLLTAGPLLRRNSKQRTGGPVGSIQLGTEWVSLWDWTGTLSYCWGTLALSLLVFIPSSVTQQLLKISLSFFFFFLVLHYNFLLLLDLNHWKKKSEHVSFTCTFGFWVLWKVFLNKARAKAKMPLTSSPKWTNFIPGPIHARMPRQGQRLASGNWARSPSLFILMRAENFSSLLFSFGVIVLLLVAVNFASLEMVFLRFSLIILGLELQEKLCNADLCKAHFSGFFSKRLTVPCLNLWKLNLIKN